MSNETTPMRHDTSQLPLATSVSGVKQPMAQLLEEMLRKQEYEELVAHDRSFSDGYDEGYQDGYRGAVSDLAAGRKPKYVPLP